MSLARGGLRPAGVIAGVIAGLIANVAVRVIVGYIEVGIAVEIEVAAEDWHGAGVDAQHGTLVGLGRQHGP
ncbi:MAG TPA: hypothetical protein PLK64_09625, partial [Dermatophilaceae bacterium]|nr:hypothetical protein [Dermatophilaceae bacterium]